LESSILFWVSGMESIQHSAISNQPDGIDRWALLDPTDGNARLSTISKA
jgi:hypothetical protein